MFKMNTGSVLVLLSIITSLDFLGEYVVDAGEQAVLAAVHPGDDPGQAQVFILLHDLGSLPLPRYIEIIWYLLWRCLSRIRIFPSQDEKGIRTSYCIYFTWAHKIWRLETVEILIQVTERGGAESPALGSIEVYPYL
jgi:hypothetical protein